MTGLALAIGGGVATLFTHGAPAQGAGKKGPQTIILTDANYRQVRDTVHPTAAELAWQTIPWRSTVWDGIVEGQASDKPILIWMLNGHPLACT